MKLFNSNTLPTTLRSLSGETSLSQTQIVSKIIYSKIIFYNLGVSSRAFNKKY